MSDPIFFAPLKVPLTDVRTGLMSREWYLFFQAMFLRIGGVQAFTPEDLQILGEMNDATDDGNDPRMADLELVASVEDVSTNPDVAELQALSACFSEDPIIARFTAQWDGLAPASGGGALKFLRADGAWAVPAYPTVPVGANPTATVGPTATNGAATTFMRSDAAPAIDLTANYSWTGVHKFTNVTFDTSLSNFCPGAGRYVLVNIAGAANAKIWDVTTSATDIFHRLVNDAASAASTYLQVTRSVTAVTALAFGSTDNPTYGFLGTGLATFSGDVKAVGKSGFNNTAPIAKPTVTGSRGANAALASLLTALSSYGLVTDSSTV